MPGGPVPVPGGDALVPLVNSLAAAHAAHGGQVVATADWHPRNHVSFHTTHPGRRLLDVVQAEVPGGRKTVSVTLFHPHCVAGSEGAGFVGGPGRGGGCSMQAELPLPMAAAAKPCLCVCILAAACCAMQRCRLPCPNLLDLPASPPAPPQTAWTQPSSHMCCARGRMQGWSTTQRSQTTPTPPTRVSGAAARAAKVAAGSGQQEWPTR